MRHPALVGAALNIVATLATHKGLALVGVPMFGVWGAPTEAHDLPAFWASRVIARAEGARRFVLLNGHKEPPLTGAPKGKACQPSGSCWLLGANWWRGHLSSTRFWVPVGS